MQHGFFNASTRDVGKSEKADYWASMLGGVWGHIQIEPTDLDRFAGSIKSVRAGQLTFNEIHYRGHNIERTSSNIARMKEAFHVLAFPQGSPWHMNIDGRATVLERGNLYLLSNTVPYKSQDREGYDTFNVMIPSPSLTALVPSLEPVYRFPLGPGNPKAQIVRDFVASLHGCLPLAGEAEAAFMQSHLLSLLAFLLEPQGDSPEIGDSSVKLAHRKRILAYIGRHLDEEDLGPDSIAQGLGISVSYLHRVFKPHGTTLVQLIRDKRLDTAERLLSDPKTAGLSVSEVAFQVGFKHCSDFSRAFKKKFGRTPKEAKNRRLQ